MACIGWWFWNCHFSSLSHNRCVRLTVAWWMTGGVGKSSLVLRFIKGTFRESYIPTIEDTYRQVRFYRMLSGSFFFTRFCSYCITIARSFVRQTTLFPSASRFGVLSFPIAIGVETHRSTYATQKAKNQKHGWKKQRTQIYFWLR